MTYHSKAPLRIGLAGGGTDVSPYTERFGGATVNATINLYAHASLEILEETCIVLIDADKNETIEFPCHQMLAIDGKMDLAKGVYNHFLKNYELKGRGLKLTTAVDTPVGSGLGTSSTLVVAIIGAFQEMLQLPIEPGEIAGLAHKIERIELGFAGGRQDQYAASFGGFNYIQYETNGEVNVQAIQMEHSRLKAFEENLVLYFTGNSRQSGHIIREQQRHVLNNDVANVEAMHHLRKHAAVMKNALEQEDIDTLGPLIDQGFIAKRQMADGIATAAIDEIYHAVKKAGATGGKISGAGGGGFMFFYCPANTKGSVIKTLDSFAGQVWPFSFTNEGLETWTTD